MLAEKANILYRYNADHEMEPYSIIKRSMDNPIFHPYFIDYGYNKEELLNRMISQRIWLWLTILCRLSLLCNGQRVLYRNTSQTNQDIKGLQKRHLHVGACSDHKKNVWNKASLECFAPIIYENSEKCKRCWHWEWTAIIIAILKTAKRFIYI